MYSPKGLFLCLEKGFFNVVRTSKLENKRAYSFIEVKAINEDKREIVGIASTPSTDRMGDIVEPQGAVFKLPIPLLWQHDHDEPIGNVTEAKITDKGIEIKAALVKVDQPSQLAARLEEAWQSIKTGLVRGLSIGFRPIEYNFLDDNGIRFTSWEWYELSAVTIPANADCSIQTIKSLDEKCLAALGNKNTIQKAVNTPTAGDSAKTKPKFVKLSSGDDNNMNIQEQIKSFESKLEALKNEKTALVNKSVDEGRTLDSEEQEKYHEFMADIKGVEDHLAILKEEEKSLIATAKPLIPSEVNKSSAIHIRDNSVIRVERNLPKGTAFTRYAIALARSKGNLMQAAEIAKTWSESTPEVANVLKAAVAVGSTTDPAWAAPLVDYQNMSSEFIELLRPQTILGKFGTGTIPSLRRVPFNIKMPGQTGGSSVGWVGQGKAKPVSSLAFNTNKLGFAKAAGIVVITEELARFSNPSAETIIRNDLIEAMAQFLDVQFIDPSIAEVVDVSPSSITNGASTIAASGIDAVALRNDLRRLRQVMISANLSTGGTVLIMNEVLAGAIADLHNVMGVPEFPDMSETGGSIRGTQVITSQSVPNGLIILAKASEILLADDGVVALDASAEASIEMNSTPAGGATTLVSLWQNNLLGLRAEQFINWKRRRSQAVSYITGANYGNDNQTT